MQYSQGAVDIIIPTYKPDTKFVRLIELLESQSRVVRNIYIINTEKGIWDSCPDAINVCMRFGNIEVTHIGFDEFDHGGTRLRAAQRSDAEFFIMMTQDAIPSDNNLVETLIDTLEQDTDIAVAYARQLPSSGTSETEKYIRKFNYPEQSITKSVNDIERMGIKTFFCSNVCAAYRHDTFDKLGGFVTKTIFNEDMIYAAKAIKAGAKIAYVADARVYHSHNYGCMEQFHRNFDLAVSQANHPEVFSGLKSESEGMRLVKDMAAHLKKVHKLYLFPGFAINCAFRLLGFKLGHNYKKLPKTVVLKFTSNKSYWK